MRDEKTLSELLDEIEIYCQVATEGPWVVVKSSMPDDWGVTETKLGMERVGLLHRKPQHQSVAQMLWSYDAEFVARSRTDLPRLVRELRERDGQCTWTLDSSEYGDKWDSACNNSWQFEIGGPKENHMRFCCYCGKVLVVVVSSDEQASP